MLDRNIIEQLAQPLSKLYFEMEIEMMQGMGKALKGKKDLLATDHEAWRLQQLELLGMLDSRNLGIIRRNSGLTTRELNQMLMNAGLQGVDLTDKEMQAFLDKGAKLLIPESFAKSSAFINILQAYERQAKNKLNATNQTMLDATKQKYIDGLNRAAIDVASGLKSHQQAIIDTINKWADNGVPGLVDRAGKEWGAEGYIRTVLVTTANNMTNEIQDQRFKDWGIEHVEVSAHVGARPLCAPYQGRIYSIDGNDSKYPDLYQATSIGLPAGLFGVNCKHRKYAYYPGISIQRNEPTSNKAENDRIYKESQKQRQIEREIRKYKKRELLQSAAGNHKAASQARDKVLEKQKQMRKFIKDTGRTRRYDREKVI